MNLDVASIFAEFEKIQNWGNAGLTAVACLAMGYLWRAIKSKWTPNQAIPAVVMLFGAFVFSGLSGHKTAGDFNWHLRALLIGFIIGFLVVLIHNYVLSRLEDYLTSKLSFLNKPTPPKP